MTDSLPRGWAKVRLGDQVYLAGRIGWRGLKADEYVKQGPLLLSTFNLNYGDAVDYRDANHITRERYNESPEIKVQENDILLTKDGAGIGKLGLVRELPEEATINSSLLLIRARESLLPEYLFYALKGPRLQGIAQERITGSTTPHLFQRDIKEFELGVAPLKEQRRIVAKLEALQARSRRAREALDAVPPLLEKLRQSILAAAFRGDVTKDWRAQNPNPEPASALLARIRTERRKKWEESELAKLKAKGKPPTDDRWKAKYKEPEPVDTTGLPELPEGWCWASVDELAIRVTDGTHQSPKFTNSGVPFVVIANVIGGAIDWSSVGKWVSQRTYDENTARCVPEQGDVLYTAVGSYGTALTVDVDRAFMFQRHIAHIKPIREIVSSRTLATMLNAPQSKSRADVVARGVAQKTVTLGELSRFPIPVAPFDEQHQLIERLEGIFESSRRFEHELTSSVARLSTLQRAILAKAFRGELVPQDPNDEPADTMLARLRSDADPESPRAGKRRSKAAE